MLDEVKKYDSLRGNHMSRWCSKCIHKKYVPCDKGCIVFGKHFDKLAQTVIKLEYENKELKERLKKKIK